MSIKMRWLGTACFEISLSSKQSIVVDPYVDDSVSAPITSDEFEGCDYLFITHGHYDHILDAGKLANRFNPKIFCSEVTASSLVKHQGVSPSLINKVIPGDVIREEGLAVEVLQGVHVDFSREYKRLTGRNLMDEGSDLKKVIRRALISLLGTDRIPEELGGWMAQYPQGEQLNFVFALADGMRIYMAGTYPDPSVIEEARRAKADITLLQVLPGKTLVGIEEEIAQLAIASGCHIAIPHHHDPLLPGAIETDLSALKRIFAEKSDIEFKELEPGEWYSF